MWYVQKIANTTGILLYYCYQKKETLWKRKLFSSERVHIWNDIKNCACSHVRRTLADVRSIRNASAHLWTEQRPGQECQFSVQTFKSLELGIVKAAQLRLDDRIILPHSWHVFYSLISSADVWLASAWSATSFQLWSTVWEYEYVFTTANVSCNRILLYHHTINHSIIHLPWRLSQHYTIHCWPAPPFSPVDR